MKLVENIKGELGHGLRFAKKVGDMGILGMGMAERSNAKQGKFFSGLQGAGR